jgi:hypothetical protein
MRILEKLKSYWSVIVQAGLWAMNIVAGFVLPPKLGVPEDEQSILNLAQFIVNILLGLIIVLSIRFRNKNHLKSWFAASLVTVLLAVFSYFTYMRTRDRCTCRYYSTTVLIGTELKNKSLEGTACSILLEKATGAADEVWTAESISNCRLSLGISYVITVPLFVIGLMSMLQALFIALTRRQTVKQRDSKNNSTLSSGKGNSSKIRSPVSVSAKPDKEAKGRKHSTHSEIS